jgi:hypothetical protein
MSSELSNNVSQLPFWLHVVPASALDAVADASGLDRQPLPATLGIELWQPFWSTMMLLGLGVAADAAQEFHADGTVRHGAAGHAAGVLSGLVAVPIL